MNGGGNMEEIFEKLSKILGEQVYQNYLHNEGVDYLSNTDIGAYAVTLSALTDTTIPKVYKALKDASIEIFLIKSGV